MYKDDILTSIKLRLIRMRQEEKCFLTIGAMTAAIDDVNSLLKPTA